MLKIPASDIRRLAFLCSAIRRSPPVKAFKRYAADSTQKPGADVGADQQGLAEITANFESAIELFSA